jgi:hypothetical protein
LVSLATIAVWSDDVSLATRLLDEARAAAERAGEETTLAHVLVLTAEVEQSRGNSETSAALLREARDLCEKTGEAEGVAECNESLAVIAIEASLFDEAEALLASSLSIVRKLRHVVLLARCAISYAAIAHSRNEDARAVQLLVAADQLLTFANAPPPPAERRLQERTAAAVRTELDRELDARRGLDQQINFDAIVTLARPDLRS